jgi:hypothetical protein
LPTLHERLNLDDAANVDIISGATLTSTAFIQSLRDDLGRPVLNMLGSGSSASLMAVALSDGIAMLPPDVDAAKYGPPLRFESLRRPWPNSGQRRPADQPAQRTGLSSNCYEPRA